MKNIIFLELLLLFLDKTVGQINHYHLYVLSCFTEELSDQNSFLRATNNVKFSNL
jgi:recombinational DNA repair ATPase RecF